RGRWQTEGCAQARSLPAHHVPAGPRAEMTAPSATVVVSATRAEQAGASMRIAGLTIAERAIKQLAQAPDTRVVVATDGTVVLPARLPDNVEIQTVKDAEAAASVAAGI